jgi:hypothetical protein
VVQLYSFFNTGAAWGWVVRATRWALNPRKAIRYPLYTRLGGLQGRIEQVGKISSPPGFDYRTVQTVANCHTDCVKPSQRQNTDMFVTLQQKIHVITTRFSKVTALCLDIRTIQLCLSVTNND